MMLWRWGGCSNVDNILAKAGNDTQAAYEPLVAGIGGQFTDAAGVAELNALWGRAQVRYSHCLWRAHCVDASV